VTFIAGNVLSPEVNEGGASASSALLLLPGIADAVPLTDGDPCLSCNPPVAEIKETCVGTAVALVAEIAALAGAPTDVKRSGMPVEATACVASFGEPGSLGMLPELVSFVASTELLEATAPWGCAGAGLSGNGATGEAAELTTAFSTLCFSEAPAPPAGEEVVLPVAGATAGRTCLMSVAGPLLFAGSAAAVDAACNAGAASPAACALTACATAEAFAGASATALGADAATELGAPDNCHSAAVAACVALTACVAGMPAAALRLNAPALLVLPESQVVSGAALLSAGGATMLKLSGTAGGNESCGVWTGDEALVVPVEGDAVCAVFLSADCFAAGWPGLAGMAFAVAAAAEASDIVCVNPPGELDVADGLEALALEAFVMGIEIRTL